MSKEIFVFKSEEKRKSLKLIKFINVFVLLKVVEQFSVKEDFSIKVLRHGFVLILYKIYNLSNRFILFNKIEKFLNRQVKSLVR